MCPKETNLFFILSSLDYFFVILAGLSIKAPCSPSMREALLLWGKGVEMQAGLQKKRELLAQAGELGGCLKNRQCLASARES